MARRTIKEKKIPISLFGRDISKAYSKHSKGTVGEFVAGYFFLGNAGKIDDVFTRILESDLRFAKLNITFFQAVITLHRYYHSREFKGLGTKYLYKHWTDFERIFDVRNRILHGMTNVRLSDNRVFCFATIH